MKKVLLATISVATFAAALATGTPTYAIQAPTPSIGYTPQQVKDCEPELIAASNGDAKKSIGGEPITATASSTVRAKKGYFLDTRIGAFTYAQDGTHLNRPGKPVVSKRDNTIFPTVMSLKSSAHRGRSFRSGRNATAFNALMVYQVKKTAACAVSLGMLK